MASRVVYECGCATCGEMQYPCGTHKSVSRNAVSVAEGIAASSCFSVRRGHPCVPGHCDVCDAARLIDAAVADLVLFAKGAHRPHNCTQHRLGPERPGNCTCGLDAALDGWAETAEGAGK